MPDWHAERLDGEWCVREGWNIVARGIPDEATARLMAASGQLAAALRGLVTFLDDANAYEATHAWEYRAYEDARAAIAKATGAR